MATTTTYRPLTGASSFVAAGWGGYWQNTGGAADAATALQDNTDTTYLFATGSVGTFGFSADGYVLMPSFTVPAGKAVKSYAVRVRSSTTSPNYGVSTRVGTVVNGVFTPVDSTWGWAAATSSPTTYATGTFAAPLSWVAGVTVSGLAVELIATENQGINVYEVYLDIVTVDLPVVTVSAPTGTVTTTTRPQVTWATTQTDGFAQTTFALCVYDAATYGAVGFNPGTTAPTWSLFGPKTLAGGWVCPLASSSTAATVSGMTKGATIGVDLAPGTYRAYVLAYDSGGPAPSVWAYSTFTVLATPPALPTFSGLWDAVKQAANVQVAGHVNLIGYDDSAFETSVGTWVATTNCSLARSTAQFKSGVASMAMTATGAGTMVARTASGLSACPVAPGQTYTAIASVRAAAAARSVQVSILWYDAAGNLQSPFTSNGALLTDAANWTAGNVSCVASAISNAAYAAVQVTVVSAAGSEVHYVDEVALYPGVPATSTNLMPNSSFESAIWLVAASCTPSQSSAQAWAGTYSMLCTWTGPTASISGIFSGLTVGLTYTASAYLYVPAGSADVFLKLVYNAAGQSATMTTKNAWTRVTFTFVATSATGYISIGTTTAANGQTCYVDAVQLEAGAAATAYAPPTTAWSAGGFASPEVVLERSDDGGTRWAQVRPATTDTVGSDGGVVLPTSQVWNVTDYEAARGTAVLYRAYILASLPLSNPTSSGYTGNLSLATTSDGTWWLKDPTVPSNNRGGLRVMRAGGRPGEIAQPVGVFRPLGRSGSAVAVFGDPGGSDGGLTIDCETSTEFEDLKTLLTNGRLLLLQEPYLDGAGVGVQSYIAVTVKNWVLDGDASLPRRTAKLTYVEVDKGF